LHERVRGAIDNALLDAQCGFRPNRGCNDQLHTIRRVCELARAFNENIYLCLVDLKKAFDSVHRDSLWKILPEYGVGPKCVEAIKDLHTDTFCRVRVDDEL
jgi:hypothetical protein